MDGARRDAHGGVMQLPSLAPWYRLLSRRSLAIAALALIFAASRPTGAQPAPANPDPAAARRPGEAARAVLLVHGAWADGSSWLPVIERLQREGYTVRAVPLAMKSLSDDVAVVRAELARLGDPVVLVGHSYGGAVIGEAAAGASNVTGLVYVAAFALDERETLTGLISRFAPTPIVEALVFDSQGNATVQPEAFVRFFAPDLPARQARALAAVQRPIAGAIFSTAAGSQAWRTLPTHFLVSRDDQVVAPALQRFVAERMRARVIELAAGHASLLSQPRTVAEAILQAARHR